VGVGSQNKLQQDLRSLPHKQVLWLHLSLNKKADEIERPVELLVEVHLVLHDDQFVSGQKVVVWVDVVSVNRLSGWMIVTLMDVPYAVDLSEGQVV